MTPNNLQHFIDQHRTLFAAIFPVYFIALWFLVGTIIGFVGGWFSLSRTYRIGVPFNGTKWRGQSGQMRWLTNYNRVLTLGAKSRRSVSGLHVPLPVHALAVADSVERDQGAKA